MGTNGFLNNVRSSWGIVDMTYDEADAMRRAWFEAMPEMAEYLKPMPCPGGPEGHDYMATTLTGRVRRYCSYCSAANAPFQGLAADGAKKALWTPIRQTAAIASGR